MSEGGTLSKTDAMEKDTSPEQIKETDNQESLNEDQRIKKRQLQFIVDELDRLYQSHSSYQVFLKKAREELIVNKGIQIISSG